MNRRARAPMPSASRAASPGPAAAPGADDSGTARAKTSRCACPAPDGGRRSRRAVAVDPAVKRRTLARLRRIEGQVRGLQRMVADERYCADVLMQIASVQQALRGVARGLLDNHLRHCVTEALRRGRDEADAMYPELLALFDRYRR